MKRLAILVCATAVALVLAATAFGQDSGSKSACARQLHFRVDPRHSALLTRHRQAPCNPRLARRSGT